MAPKKKMSLLKGCLIGCLVVLVIAGVVAAFLGWFAYSTYRGLKNTLADTPREIPVATPTAAEVQAVGDKVGRFQQAWEKGEAGQLELTAAELNTLIAQSDDSAQVRGRVAVKALTADGAVFSVSVPMKDLSPGKYLNGDLAVGVVFEQGKLKLTFQDFQDNGKRPPRVVLAALRRMDLVAQATSANPQVKQQVAELEKRLAGLQLSEGKVTISLKQQK